MELRRLFGSRVRAETLRALALTSAPQSGYRLAKAAGAQPIQVLSLLKELRPLVEHVPGGWVLRDDRLREFLRADLRAQDEVRRHEKDQLLDRLGLRASVEHERRRV